jgi:hypothetical protein
VGGGGGGGGACCLFCIAINGHRFLKQEHTPLFEVS